MRNHTFIVYQYEREGVAKVEELENTKLKLQARLAECEGTVENLNGKLIQLLKLKILQEVAVQLHKSCECLLRRPKLETPSKLPCFHFLLKPL